MRTRVPVHLVEASMTVKRRSYCSPVREASASQTRGRIVAAASALLAEGGRQPFSLEAVAQRAGVTRLTVYNHFESKRGVMEAVFDDLTQNAGMFELTAVFADSDPRRAVNQLVALFCNFWSARRAMVPKFRAPIVTDDEVAPSVMYGGGWRRQGLTVLVERLTPASSQRSVDLIDVLCALTSFEMFEALSVRNRRPKAVEALLQALVEQAIGGAIGQGQ
jgi:AcrR family transcriptional regulator